MIFCRLALGCWLGSPSVEWAWSTIRQLLVATNLGVSLLIPLSWPVIVFTCCIWVGLLNFCPLSASPAVRRMLSGQIQVEWSECVVFVFLGSGIASCCACVSHFCYHAPAKGHLGCFLFWRLWIGQQWRWPNKHLWNMMLSWVYATWGMGHIVDLFLVFWGFTYWFSRAAAPITSG